MRDVEGLFTMLAQTARSPRRQTNSRIRAIVKRAIVPSVAAAFENHPQLDVAEVLSLCEPALVQALLYELRHELRVSANAESRRGRSRQTSKKA